MGSVFALFLKIDYRHISIFQLCKYMVTVEFDISVAVASRHEGEFTEFCLVLEICMDYS